MAVEVARLLNKTDGASDAVPVFELAIKAYTAKLIDNDDQADTLQTGENLKPVAENLSKQMKEFSLILENAGNHERATRVLEFSKELKEKLSKGEKIDSDWLVQVP